MNDEVVTPVTKTAVDTLIERLEGRSVETGPTILTGPSEVGAILHILRAVRDVDGVRRPVSQEDIARWTRAHDALYTAIWDATRVLDLSEKDGGDPLFGVSPIRARFGTWAITEYGVECMTENYPIEWSRINETDWDEHMSMKTWVKMSDFRTALGYAREIARIEKESRDK